MRRGELVDSPLVGVVEVDVVQPHVRLRPHAVPVAANSVRFGGSWCVLLHEPVGESTVRLVSPSRLCVELLRQAALAVLVGDGAEHAVGAGACNSPARVGDSLDQPHRRHPIVLHPGSKAGDVAVEGVGHGRHPHSDPLPVVRQLARHHVEGTEQQRWGPDLVAHPALALARLDQPELRGRRVEQIAGSEPLGFADGGESVELSDGPSHQIRHLPDTVRRPVGDVGAIPCHPHEGGAHGIDVGELVDESIGQFRDAVHPPPSRR